MRKSGIGFFVLFACLATSANANWQYSGRYKRDAWDGDNGMRFVMSLRGGAALGKASIHNDIGGLTGQYVMDTVTGEIYTKAWYDANYPSGSTDFVDAGYGRLGDLPPSQDYKEMSVFVGFSAGLTLPDTPQWRIEFGVDHIAESDYNPNPLFEGNLALSYGDTVDAQSGGVQSTLSNDIYSVMAFHDFFDGLKKPMHEAIPYLGFGLGYANAKTVLQLTDSYGDLSDVYELQDYGVIDEYGVVKFNKAETTSNNLAPIIAGGFSYGFSDRMFLDVGVRAMYMNKIKWQLTNSDNSKRRDWFSADKVIYVMGHAGLRIEF